MENKTSENNKTGSKTSEVSEVEDNVLDIRRNEIQKFFYHAAAAYPKECCGILLGSKKDGKVEEIYQARNADAIDRQRLHFVINPLEIYRIEKEAEKRKKRIIGFYHSHVDCPAVLSAEDERSMIPGLLYMIISVINGECTDIKSYTRTKITQQ